MMRGGQEIGSAGAGAHGGLSVGSHSADPEKEAVWSPGQREHLPSSSSEFDCATMRSARLDWHAPSPRRYRRALNTWLTLTILCSVVGQILGAQIGVERVLAAASPNAATPTSGLKPAGMAVPICDGFPLNLQAIPLCGSIRLTWQKPPAVTPGSYRVYRNGFANLLGETTNLNFVDPNPAPGLTYQYDVHWVVSGVQSSQFACVIAGDLTPPRVEEPDIVPRCGSIRVRWNGVAQAANYRILKNGYLIAETTLLEYEDLNPTPGGSYQIQALNGECLGQISHPSNGTTALQTPGTPPNFRVVAGCDTVFLSWDMASGTVDGYRVYRSDESNAILQVGSQALTAFDVGSRQNATYEIVAYNAACDGPRSAPAGPISTLSIPDAPVVTTLLPDCGTLTVTWDDSNVGLLGYVVNRDDGLLTELSSSIRTFVDLAPPPNSRYRVAAVSGGCRSPFSPFSGVASPLPVPRPPGDAPLVQAACRAIQVTWDAPPGNVQLAGYSVFRNDTLVSEVPTTPRVFNDPDPPPNSSYRIAARGLSCLGPVSEASRQITILRPAPLDAPDVTAGCGVLDIRWSAPQVPVTGYRLLRNGSPIGSVLPPIQLFYRDTSVSGSASYQVIALSGSGCESAPSGLSEAVSPGLKPAPPPVRPDVAARCGELVVSWGPSVTTEVTDYLIYRNTVLIDSTDVEAPRQYVDRLAQPGSYYEIAARIGACEGSKSDRSLERSPLPVPGTPAAPSATPICGGIRVSWNAPAGDIDGYRLFRNDTTLVDLLGAPTVFDDTTATDSAHYKLQALGSPCSSEVSAASKSVSPLPRPDRPPAPGVTPRCGTIRVAWPAPGGDVTGYRLYRNGTRLQDLGAGERGYLDQSPTADNSYQLSVVSGGCESVRSEPTAPVAADLAPITPLITGVDTSCVSITLTWTPVEDVSDFAIQRDGATIAVLAGTEVTYSDPEPEGGRHGYVVVARNACGESPSAEVLAGLVEPLITPSQLAATPGCELVRLNWQPSVSATGYQVFRDDAEIASIGQVTEFEDRGGGSTSHGYSIQALGECGESPRSAAVSAAARTSPAVPPAPILEQVCAGTRVSWSGVVGAESYTLLRDGAPIGDGIAGTSFTDTAPGQVERCYAVVASAAGCSSTPSAAACGQWDPCDRQIVLNLVGSGADEDYRLVTFPLRPVESSLDSTLEELGPPDSTSWRLGHWDPNLGVPPGMGAYQAAGSGLTHLVPGHGYWLLSLQNVQIRISGKPITDDPFVIELIGPENSWHQIGNPFLSQVPVASIQVGVGSLPPVPFFQQSGNGTALGFHRWRLGAYSAEATTLDTLTGYWILKLTEEPVRLQIPRPSPGQAVPEPGLDGAWPAAARWGLALRARQGTRASGHLYLGVAPVEAGTWNPLSLAVPPAPGRTLTLTSRELRWGTQNGEYLSHYLPDTDSQEWSLRLAGLEPVRSVRLEAGGYRLPPGRRVLVTDLRTGTRRLWLPDTILEFTPHSETLALRLVVEPDDGSPVGQIPGSVRLRAAPNPFVQRTEIEFPVSLAERSTLRIFDAAGRLVRELQAGIEDEGVARVTWDGRDDLGLPVPGGVYFARAGDPTSNGGPLRLVRLPN